MCETVKVVKWDAKLTRNAINNIRVKSAKIINSLSTKAVEWRIQRNITA